VNLGSLPQNLGSLSAQTAPLVDISCSRDSHFVPRVALAAQIRCLGWLSVRLVMMDSLQILPVKLLAFPVLLDLLARKLIRKDHQSVLPVLLENSSVFLGRASA